MKRTILTATVSAAALSLGVHAAMAQTTTLNGGGSTLAQPTYDNSFTQYTNNNASTLFSYDGVGSGAGQTAFLNNDITQFNNSATQYGTIVGSTVHFGASDAALTSAQVSTYNMNLGSTADGPLIQIPTFGTPITIPFNNSGASKKGLTLTDSQVCGVFSGLITNWNQLSSTATPGPITVVYRSDSSGTTFLLSQHLKYACNANNSNFVQPIVPTKTFITLFANSTPPGNFVGESGSSQVAPELENTSNSIGYLSPDYTSIAKNGGSGNGTNLLVASVVNSTDGVAYQPVPKNTTTGLANAIAADSSNVSPPSKSASSDPTMWIPMIGDTSKGYPIVGYTTVELSSCYADATAGMDIVNFFTTFLGKSSYATIETENGFVPLVNSGASKFVTAIDKTFFSNKLKLNLNVDGSECMAGKGR